MAAPPIIFGGAVFTPPAFNNAQEVREYLDVLEELGVKEIDTATFYGDSEKLLGEAQAATRFKIHTKHPGAVGAEPSSKDVVIASGKESLTRLGTSQVDIYYIHHPDLRIGFKDTLEGINVLYKSGAFRRFGLSNFSLDQTEEALRICREQDFVLPTVYQGNYNAVGRLSETDLFPILRENNIAFYAYSPIAGGFLAKTQEQLKQGKGRWDPNSFMGKFYLRLYLERPATFRSLGTWNEIAAAEGISASELAFRWVFHNSALDATQGDAVIIGASSTRQLRDTVAAIRKGPLSPAVQEKIQGIWEAVKHEAFSDILGELNKATA